ncbi:MAG: WD40 repeat domain-containing protein [Isosphaeraceae bacterium]
MKATDDRRRSWRTLGRLAGVLVTVGILGFWWSREPSLPLPRKVVLRGARFLGPIAFSPDSSRLATFDEDRRLDLWDLSTGRVVSTFKPQVERDLFAFAPDGRSAAWVAPRGNGRSVPHLVVVVEVTTGGELARLEVHRPIVLDLGFSPDGTIFRAIGWNTDAGVSPAEAFEFQGWDTASWTPRPPPTVSVPRASGPLAISPDGRLVVTASRISPATLREVATGRELAMLQTPGNVGVSSLRFTPDGREIVFGTSDGVVGFWNVATGSLVGTNRLLPDSYRLMNVRVDETGRHVVGTGWLIPRKLTPADQFLLTARRFLPFPGESSRSHPSSTVVWDVTSGRALASFPQTQIGVLSPDGRFLATTDGPEVTVWELPRLKASE